MVQLRDESSEASESSPVVKTPPKQNPVWPFVLLTLAVGLLAVGVHHILNTKPDEKIGCPFTAVFGSKVIGFCYSQCITERCIPVYHIYTT